MVLSDEERKARAKERASSPKYKAKVSAYQKKRYATDPEFKKKKDLANVRNQQERYATDPEFKKKRDLESRRYQKKGYEPDGVYAKAKAKVFGHYSKVISNSDVPICACCGYSDLRFLSVDHIDGRKSMSEKEKKLGSRRLWIHLIKTGLPSGYQILCHNCNIAKGQEKYCPHQLDKMK